MNQVSTELRESYLFVKSPSSYLRVRRPEGVRRNALRVLRPSYPHSEKVAQYIEQNKHISRTSVGFRWLLDCSQVARRLRDHFATTVAHLSPSCITAVALCFHLFVFHMPLYIIGVLNTQRLSVFVLKVGEF